MQIENNKTNSWRYWLWNSTPKKHYTNFIDRFSQYGRGQRNTKPSHNFARSFEIKQSKNFRPNNEIVGLNRGLKLMRNYNNLHNDLHEILLNTITPDWQSYKQLRHTVNQEMRKITGWKYYSITLHVLGPILLNFDRFYPLEWKKESIGGTTIYFVRLKRWWE